MKPSNLTTVLARLLTIGASIWATAFLVLCGRSAHGAAPEGLAPSAAADISALLAEKASWTHIQAKMDSELIHAVKNHRGQAFARGLSNLRLDVQAHPDGRVLVDITANVSSGLLTLIRQGGGEVIASFPQFRAVRALVRLNQLEALAGSGEVVFIQRAVRAITNTGSVDSQGDVTHMAGAARTGFAASGAGIKVGVPSDSVDYLTNSQALGDLGPVTVLPGQSGLPGSGEGTAMLEIVHDLAPSAQLYFATAFISEASFAQNILNLYSNGCNIIIDDVGYFDESPFQDGIVARAVNTVTAGGALYFSSAANSGNLDAGTSGTWEGDFVDGGAAMPPISETGRIHSFGATNYNTITASGFTVDLFWSDPLGASTNDYDLFLLDSTGSTVVGSSMNRQTGTQDPYERISGSTGQRIVIVKYSGASRFLHLDTQRGRLSIPTAGATVGHSAATNAYSVAAVNAASAFPNPFSGGANNPVETFSSDGPRHVFYQADGTAITAGNFLSNGGAIRQKPDIAAADGVVTTLPAGSGLNPFFGTSVAAPHAGAIAALIWSYRRALTPAQMRSLLTSTALDIGPPGTDRDSGAGIVMAYQALTNLTGTTPLAINLQPSNQTVAVGGTATFSVTAVGTQPLSYSWQRNGTLLAGATSSTYTTNNVQLADSGSEFSCQVSNVQGSLLSSNGTLTVVVPPANDLCSGATIIATTNYTNSESTVYATSTGDPAPACVAGFGKGVWYQYTAPADGQLVVDTVGSDFDTGLGVYTGTCGSLTQVACNDDAGGFFTSRITNSVAAGTNYYILAGGYAAHAGNLVFDLAFTAFTGPPVIVTQPANQRTFIGGTARFSVGATGGRPLNYQWRKEGQPIASATNSAYSVGNAQTNDAGNYSVVVTNSLGSITSSNATLTVLTNSGLVAYFTDNNPSATGYESPIITAGFIPLHVLDISTLGFTNFGLLCINEYNNGPISTALQARLADIQSWVTNGGRLIVHDRSAGLLSPNPFLLGATGAVTVRLTTSDLDVIPPATNPVVAGPFGVINNTNLDGGASSAHGYVALANLPAAASGFLCIGGSLNEVVAFSYSLGAGTIYYSSTPLDCYLADGGCTNNVIAPPLQNIYTPNVLTYASSLTACTNCRPAILVQPASLTVRQGTNVSFSVTANGTQPLSYQWLKNGVGLVDGSKFSGAKTASLTISNIANKDAGQYSVFVSNSPGSVLSSNATLTVLHGKGGSALSLTSALGSHGAQSVSSLDESLTVPRLELGSDGKRLMILWTSDSAWVLETATELSPEAWVPVADAPLQIGDQYGVPVEITQPQRFYRLRFSTP